ncbi:MAG: sodium:proton antiporter, partial [Bacteroidales bacterium]|nr:sodium:proton antiporter [Bacteroidales bacterium]
MKGKSVNTEPSWWVALVPVAVLVSLLFCVVKFFGADALSGGSQVALILSSGVVIAISIFIYGKKWSDIESSIENNIKGIGSALIILLLIGAISGTWMISGIVPTLMCYGIK